MNPTKTRMNTHQQGAAFCLSKYTAPEVQLLGVPTIIIINVAADTVAVAVAAAAVVVIVE